MTLDNLLEHTEQLKHKINSLHWDKEDVRHGFYGLIYSTLYDYYIGRITFELSSHIGSGKVLFSDDIIYLDQHIYRLREIAKIDRLSHGFSSSLNRNLILGSWTSFETCITLIFNHITTDQDIESLINSLNSKLIKAISKLEDNFQTTIIDILKKSSFIPLARKFNFLVKKGSREYGVMLKADREFIEFYGTMRNCLIHSNGIYFGKKKEYNFYGTHFIFENGKVFLQKETNENIPCNMTLRLVEIFDKLVNNLRYIEFIEHPSKELKYNNIK